jgi:hypothetical protein
MNNNLIVEFEEDNQEVQFENTITGISIDGQKLSDTHDLTQKVIRMTKTIQVLAWLATSLAVLAVTSVLFMTHWLLSHESSIEQLLLTGNDKYNQMRVDSLAWNAHKRERAYVHLKEFHRLEWDEDMQDWVKAPPPPPPLKPNPIGGANHLDLKWAGR